MFMLGTPGGTRLTNLFLRKNFASPPRRRRGCGLASYRWQLSPQPLPNPPYLVTRVGFEPTTPTLGRWRSIH